MALMADDTDFRETVNLLAQLQKESRDDVKALVAGSVRLEKTVSDLAHDVAALKRNAPPRSRQLARDGGLATGAGAIAVAVMQYLAAQQKPAAPPPPARPVATETAPEKAPGQATPAASTSEDATD